MQHPAEKQLRVLAIIPGDSMGASFIFAKRQVESMALKGIDAQTFFLTSRTNPFDILKESRRFKKVLKEFQPDILHAHYGTVTSFFAAIFSSKPLIITLQGSDINHTPGDGFFRNLFGRLLTQLSAIKAKKVICVSEKLRQQLWNKNKGVIIPIGVRLDTFQLMERNNARKELGWNTSDKIVLFNANNPVVKRLDLAEKAIELVKKEIPEATLEVLGGGTNPSLIPLYLNAADCLLICSDNEGSPVIVKEALACNLPVCGTDVGDVKERIEGTEPVAIVKQDVNDMAKSLVYLLSKNKRSNGREVLISQGLDDKQVIEKIIHLYKEVYK